MRPSTSHLSELVRKRDFYAGGLMILLGLGIALKGATYRAGTLMAEELEAIRIESLSG